MLLYQKTSVMMSKSISFSQNKIISVQSIVKMIILFSFLMAFGELLTALKYREMTWEFPLKIRILQ